MRIKPDALDYESVFPGRKGRGRDSDAQAEAWPSSEKLRSFDNDQAVVPGPAPRQQTSTFSVLKDAGWLRRGGHSFSFSLLFLFSIILYLRPYELIPALSSLTQMAFYTGVVLLAVYAITQLSLEGNLTARPREINLVLLLGLAALLSMPLADDPAGAWERFSTILLKTILIFVVFVNVVRTELRLKMLLLLVLGVSIYLSVNAINDYRMGVFKFGAQDSQDARIAGSIKGLFENSNDLALHLVTMVPIAVTLGLSGRSVVKKLLYFGATALMVGAIIVTFSRGGFIGLVAATLVLVRRLGKKNKTATSAAVVFAVILFLALAPGAYSGRLSTIFNSAADVTMSSSQRNEILKRSIWVSLRYPVFGVGIGNFKHKSPRNLETHNAYTQVSAELGLAAMVVYILFLIHPLKRLRLIENESYSKHDQTRFYYLAIGLQGSLVGFMVSSFFGAVAYHWYVYYLVGYAVCLHRLYIMKFQPEHPFPSSFWQQPFAKKTEKLMSSEPVSQ